MKIRIYSKSEEELWLHEWKNPLSHQIAIGNPTEFLRSLQRGVGPQGYNLWVIRFPPANYFICRCYIDKIQMGFIAWSKTIKGYSPVSDPNELLIREAKSQAPLQAIQQIMKREKYLQQLSVLWGQESNKTGMLDIRSENVLFIKYLGNFYFFLEIIELEHINFS